MKNSTRRSRRHRNPKSNEKEQQPTFFSKAHDTKVQTKEESGFFQPKLDISKADDPHEKEADAVANNVVHGVKQQQAAGVQKKEQLSRMAEPEEKPKAKLQRMAEEEQADAKLQRAAEEEEAAPKLQKMDKEEPKAKLQRMAPEEEARPKLQRMAEEEKADAKLQRAEKEEEASAKLQRVGKEEESAPKLQKMDKEEEAAPKLQRMAEEEQADAKLQRAEKEEKAEAKLQKMDKEEPKAKLQREAKEEEAVATKLQTKSEARQQAAEPKRKKKDATSHLEQMLKGSKSKGFALPFDVRTEMEAQFNVDFSEVRIHTDAEAIEMCEKIRAQAFAHGFHIYFNAGKYNPDTDTGKNLLAHELTHVVQQKGG